MASKQKIAAVIGVLCEVYNRQPTAATYRAYEMGLDGISDEQLDRAGLAVLQSSTQKFMPTPGELRLSAFTEGRGIESRIDDAWRSLNRAIDRYGHGRSVNFRDALVNATVRLLGGWERVCRLTRDEFDKWYYKDFRTTYGRLMDSGCPPDAAGYLVGETERLNGPWVGQPCLRDGKPYELPAPYEVNCHYIPMLESPTAEKQICSRPDTLPKLKLKTVHLCNVADESLVDRLATEDASAPVR